MSEVIKVIDGVGEDVEIVTNENGGKQSKSPMALHLVDPKFLEEWAKNSHIDMYNTQAIIYIAEFMTSGDKSILGMAINVLERDHMQQLIRIAKVLQYGADRYEPNNWRLIPQEQHINHALIHILAEIMGDTQDSHTDHALCRLMMAHATEKSEGFDYNKYIPKK